MGGMVLETNMTEILLRVQEQDKLEKQEVTLGYKSFFILDHLGWNISRPCESSLCS
jgi:hypothetical protein